MNASGITGLASRTAIALRQRGVSVASVSNLPSSVRPHVGTVFYPAGERAQGQLLASISGASAVEPAPAWLPAGGTLVLVVTGTLARS